jgi:hypothetical protein
MLVGGESAFSKHLGHSRVDSGAGLTSCRRDDHPVATVVAGEHLGGDAAPRVVDAGEQQNRSGAHGRSLQDV